MLGKITITPGTPNHISFDAPTELNKGQTYQLKPMLAYSNDLVEPVDITNDALTKYTSSNTELLTVNTQGLIQVPANVKSGYATVEVTYGNVRKVVVIKINGGNTDSYLEVSPLLINMSSGKSQQIKVVEVNDGARKDVTNSSSGITYTSTDSSIVTVTPDGLISAISEDQQGTFYINVNYKGLNAKTTVKITKPTVKSLSISPLQETLSLSNNKLQLVLKAFMTDGTTKDVTVGSEGTKYTSSDPKRATVDANGLVSIPPDAITGKVIIKATNNNLIAQTSLTIDGNPELTGIQIVPESLTMYPGGTKKLQVLAKYSNDTTKDITAGSSGVVYTSSVPAQAGVSVDGEVTVPANANLGTAVVTVKYDVLKATVVLNVVKDITNDIQSIVVSPDVLTLMPGDIQQLKVTATMGDNRLKDITASSEGTIYTSSIVSQAIVDTEGKISIAKDAVEGTVVITAKNGTFQSKSVITIANNPAKEMKSIAVTPSTVSLSAGKTQQLVVAATMGDGTKKDITASSEGTVYTSSIPERAVVNAEGIITIPSNASLGTVVITAKNGKLQSTVTVTVGPDPATQIKSLTITPSAVTLSAEDTQQLTVNAVMGDDSLVDLTSSSKGTTYISSSTEQVTVDTEGKITIAKLSTAGTVVITAKNGTLQSKSIISIVNNPAKEIKSIAATPSTVNLSAGKTQQIVVTATMGDGTKKDITASSEGTVYTSSIPERAIVNAEGNITIPSNASLGTVVITAKTGKLQSTVIVTVGPDPATQIKSLAITPSAPTLSAEDTLQLTVNAVMGDDSLVDLTGSSKGTTYTSSNTEQATVDAEGKITIAKFATAGTVVITAKNGTLQSKSVISIVNNPAKEIKSIAVSPSTVTLSAGKTQQLVVTATMGDGKKKDMTASSEGTVYTSSNTARATVANEGLITIPSSATLGTVTITAKIGTFQSVVNLTVGKDPATEIKSLAVSPSTVTLSAEDMQQLTVNAVMGDDSLVDLTSSSKGTTYTSSIPEQATVDAEGKITIAKFATAGTVVITAKNGTLQSKSVISIVNNPAKEIKSIAVSPSTVTLSAGKTQQLVVTATMGDGKKKDMTASSEGTLYTSSNTARATVDTEGKITIPSSATLGTVTITAKIGTFQSVVNLTVGKDPATEIKSITVTPSTVTLSAEDIQQLTVNAVMGDDSLVDLTSSSKGTTYISSNTTQATVDAEGKITIAKFATAGTVVITAKNGTLQSKSVISIVNNPAKEIKSIVVSPSTVALSAGKTQQLVVTATMGDGKKKDMTASSEGTLYTSSNTARAIVDTEGKITIPSSATLGTVTITAKIGTLQSSVSVTVGQDPATEVRSIAITPSTVNLPTGGMLLLVVNAVMGDGSLKDISGSAKGTIYTSSIPERAVVDAEGNLSIPSNATLGTVVITAKNGTFKSTVTVTVSKDPATEMRSISITPSAVSLSAGSTRQLIVTATMEDDSLKDVTASTKGTVYTSSNTNYVVVNAEGLITIPSSTPAGTVTITAKNGTLKTVSVITITN